MGNIKVVSQIPSYRGWEEVKSFKSLGRVVDVQGRQVRIIAKKERSFSFIERIERFFLGVLRLLPTLLCSTYSWKTLRKLVTAKAETVRFAIPHVVTSSPTSSPTKRVINQLNLHTNKEAIEAALKQFVNTSGEEGASLFSLAKFPNYIFRTATASSEKSILARHENMQKAAQVCRDRKLDRLVVPDTELFCVEHAGSQKRIFMEEKLDTDANVSHQEHYFNNKPNLEKTVRQLAVFICETGFDNVDWHSIPFLQDSAEPKIGLIDLESMDDPSVGLFGCPHSKRRGLVRCVTQSHWETIGGIAQDYGVDTDNFEAACRHRLRELELIPYHQNRGIKTGTEALIIGENALGLPLAQEVSAVNIKSRMDVEHLLLRIVDAINSKLQASSDADTPAARRRFTLDTEESPFIDLGNRAAYDKTTSWVGHILQTLVEKGYLFSYTAEEESKKYHIQA